MSIINQQSALNIFLGNINVLTFNISLSVSIIINQWSVFQADSFCGLSKQTRFEDVEMGPEIITE